MKRVCTGLLAAVITTTVALTAQSANPSTLKLIAIAVTLAISGTISLYITSLNKRENRFGSIRRLTSLCTLLSFSVIVGLVISILTH